MVIVNVIIPSLWLIFIITWVIFAFTAKRTIRTNTWWRGGLFRVAIFIIIVFWFDLSPTSRNFFATQNVGFSLSWQMVGLLLVIAGVGLAIWARIYLGKNWGTPMSLKVDPELVTSGPYAFIRHPIYSGMLCAMLGSALASWRIFFIVFVVAGAYFIFSATREEKIMANQFPDQYAAYKKKTKMLIPFML